MRQLAARRKATWAGGAALVLACVAVVVPAQVHTGVDAAEGLIRDVQEQVRARLEREGEALRSNLPGLYAVVDELIVPHVDINTMCRLVLGQHWKKADAEQRAHFATEFSHLMVRTYARSLLDYDQYQVEFLPAIPGKRKGTAMVRTELVSTGNAARLPIAFRMREKGGTWRMVDLIVNGISLVTTYRESFGAQVSSGGLGPLIAQLKEKNARMNTAEQ